MTAPLPATRFDAVPAELRDRPQWVAWRYEQRGDKRTKVPVNPATNRNASSTDQATWGTFETALTALDWYPANGIGFVLSADDPYFMVDLDNAYDIDMLHPWASEIVDRFPDCYCEISPSGQGLRIIGRGTLPSGGNRRGQIELYDRARFSTITGTVYDGMATIGPDCTEALTAFHAELFAPVIAVTTPVQAAPSIAFTDDELLARALAAKNGEKLRRILSGDINGYDSASEADAAAAAMLKFWTQDAEQIERILRLSSLQRDKWDEHKTYLDTTVKNALALPGETFNAPSNIVDFRTHLNGGSSGKNSDPPSDDQTVAGFRLSDIGNGQRLAYRIKGRAMHCHPAKRWYVYDGQRWNDDALGYLMRWAKESVLTMYDALSALEDKDRTALLKHALKSESERSLNAAINLARSEDGIPVLPDEFDREPMLLNVENGTIDLATGELRPHSPDDRISKLAPVTFDPDATCPKWLAFLEQIFEGDQERITYLQRALGYCLTGDTRERAVFIAYGAGRNGKTTLSRLLMSILGDYAKRTPTETIMSKKHEGGIPNHDLAPLVNVRFATVSETEEGRKLNVAKVKDMAGDEVMSARFLYQEEFEFRPKFKLWISTNHKPVIPGNDQAIFDRFHLIPFTYRVPDDQEDKGLERKLEAERSGILNWLLQGCRDWYRDGLKPPQRVTDATSEYRQEMDLIGNFLTDVCVIGDGYQITSNALYAAYKKWCETNSETPISGVWFGRRISERGFESIRIGKNRTKGLTGVAVNEENTVRQTDLADGKNIVRTWGRTVADGNSGKSNEEISSHRDFREIRSASENTVRQEEKDDDGWE